MLRTSFQKTVGRCRPVCQVVSRFCYTGNDHSDESLRGSTLVMTGDRGVNQVTLIGRLGHKPEMRGTEENPVTILSLATSFNLKTPAGNYVQKTDWHRISIFRPVLRDYVVNTMDKGDRLYIGGRISYGQYVPPGQTEPIKVTSIIADEVINLTSRSSSAQNSGLASEAVDSSGSSQ